jgi:hypothetical protein
MHKHRRGRSWEHLMYTGALGTTRHLIFPNSIGFFSVTSTIRLRPEAHVRLHHVRSVHFDFAGRLPPVAHLALADRACSLLAQPWVDAVHMKLRAKCRSGQPCRVNHVHTVVIRRQQSASAILLQRRGRSAIKQSRWLLVITY